MYYQKSVENVAKELSVNTQIWLTDRQVKDNQEKYWYNILTNNKKISAWKVFLNQFKSFLILILIVAAVISIFVWEAVDSVVIILIVILNSILGFVQEYKAEKSIESLKKMASLKSRVIRNGKEILIDSQDLTVWDILIFDAWDKIWADARIIQSMSAEVAEAVLTGESMPVSKNIETINKDCALWDQKNMLFAGTVVTRWHGKAIVTAIGMQTEIGKIAGMLQDAPEKQTNLQKDLDKLSKWLGAVVIVICAIVFVSAIFFVWNTWQQAFLVAIALSVAAIPEWLPAVVTIALWLGVKRLVKKNALMRKLSSVETLWSVNIICTDKTWTLTKNEMTVKHIFVDNKIFDLYGVGYEDFGDKDFLSKNKENKNSLEQILKIWILCNNSAIDWENVIWDPTEVALLVSAIKWWLIRKNLEKEYKLIDEIPFDSERKLMTTIYSEEWKVKREKLVMFSKGAPEILLDKCSHILVNGEVKKMTEKDKKNILSQNKKFAESALRVLGFAYKIVESLSSSQVESWKFEKFEEGLVFVGLQAMIDPPRLEVGDSINICEKAGIRVVMITGDNVITAKAIAEELWIKWLAMDGVELDKLDDKKLLKIISDVWVFARVSPANKQRIVKLLKKRWNIVAMTDNFATIVNAIYEWRWIYDNIKKFVNYLLSTNLAEILIIFISVLVGMPLPLIAIQILWINLVSDGLPALALWVDPASPDIMSHKPRKLWSKIVDRKMIINIVVLSIAMTIWCLFLFARHQNVDLVQARTWVFVLLTLLEMLRIWMIRDEYKLPFWSNKWLFAAVWSSIWLVLLVVYIPFFAEIFQTKPLSWMMWIEMMIILFVLFVLAFVVNRIKKWRS